MKKILERDQSVYEIRLIRKWFKTHSTMNEEEYYRIRMIVFNMARLDLRREYNELIKKSKQNKLKKLRGGKT